MKENNDPQADPASETDCPACGSPGRFSFESRDLFYDKPETYRYDECRRCEAIYQSPVPSPEQVAGFYPDEYDPYAPIKGPHRISATKAAVLNYGYGYPHLSPSFPYRVLAPLLMLFKHRDAIDFVPEGRALDIGCGNGKFVRTMNALGWDCEGLDFSPVAVEAARAAGLTATCGDLSDAGFADGAFDLVTARHMIEHTPDPDALVGEITRILKRGGRLVIETPNNRALARGWFGKYWYANEVPRHIVLFNTKSLNTLAERHGLRHISGRMLSSPKMILNSLDYVTRNGGKPSRKRKLLRLLVQPYLLLAALTGRGDMIYSVYEKA